MIANIEPPVARQLHALTGLRAISACYVVVFHYSDYGDVFGLLARNGRTAMSLFFCLSGFIMTLTYKDKCTMQHLECRTAFWWRIMPAFWVSLLAAPQDIAMCMEGWLQQHTLARHSRAPDRGCHLGASLALQLEHGDVVCVNRVGLLSRVPVHPECTSQREALVVVVRCGVHMCAYSIAGHCGTQRPWRMACLHQSRCPCR